MARRRNIKIAGSICDLPHPAVHADGHLVALSDEEVHEPPVIGISSSLETVCEQAGKAQSTAGGGDRQCSDVSVPGEVMLGVQDLCRGRLELAHD